MLATKFFEDKPYDNATWSKLGGIPTLELNRLEEHLLFFLEWTMNIQVEDYYSYEREVVASGAGLFESRRSSEKLFESPTSSEVHEQVESSSSLFEIPSEFSTSSARQTFPELYPCLVDEPWR